MPLPDDVLDALDRLALPSTDEVLHRATRHGEGSSSPVVLTGTPVGKSESAMLLQIDGAFVDVPLSAILSAETSGAQPLTLMLRIRPDATLMMHLSVPARSAEAVAQGGYGSAGVLPFALALPSQAERYAAPLDKLEAIDAERAARLGFESNGPGDRTGVTTYETVTQTQGTCNVTSTDGTVDTVVDFHSDSHPDHSWTDTDA